MMAKKEARNNTAWLPFCRHGEDLEPQARQDAAIAIASAVITTAALRS
jgi:hypothetical protein